MNRLTAVNGLKSSSPESPVAENEKKNPHGPSGADNGMQHTPSDSKALVISEDDSSDNSSNSLKVLKSTYIYAFV